MSRFQVKKVAVLGAGVMGAQIAAHLVNVKVPVVLFDLPAKEGPKNGIVTKAVEGLKKLKPSPLGVADDAALIGQANYEEHLEQLRDCDLIIEAIAERMDWKLDLYKKIAPFVNPNAIVASNTSGQSITTHLLERLHVLGERYVRKHLEPLGRDQRANDEHSTILRLWLNRDGNAAASVIESHIEKTIVDLRRQLTAVQD